MARRKKTKAVTAKQKKGKSKNETTSPEDSNEADLNTSGCSEFTLCISDDSDLVIEDSVAESSSVQFARTDERLNEKAKSLGTSSSIIVTEALVDLTESNSPKTRPSSRKRSTRVAVADEPDRVVTHSEGILVPQENIIEESETIIEETVSPPKRSGKRRDSESSDEYDYSTIEGSEPISIEEMIGGVGSTVDSEYLLYDSVLNSALRSEVGCNIVIEACDVDEIPPGEEHGTKEKESSAGASIVTVEDEEVTVAVEPEPLQVTKKEGDTFYSPRRRDRNSATPSSKNSTESNSPPPREQGQERMTVAKNLFENTSELNVPGISPLESGKNVKLNDKYDGFETRSCSVRVERMENSTLSDKRGTHEPMDTTEETKPQEFSTTDEEIAKDFTRINIEKKTTRRSSETSGPRGRAKPSLKKEKPLESQAGKTSNLPPAAEPMEVDSVSERAKETTKHEFNNLSAPSSESPSSYSILHEADKSITESSTEALKITSNQHLLNTIVEQISIVDSVNISHSEDTKVSIPSAAENKDCASTTSDPRVVARREQPAVENVEVSSSSGVPEKPTRPRRQTRQPRRIADAVKPRGAPKQIKVSPHAVPDSKADAQRVANIDAKPPEAPLPSVAQSSVIPRLPKMEQAPSKQPVSKSEPLILPEEKLVSQEKTTEASHDLAASPKPVPSPKVTPPSPGAVASPKTPLPSPARDSSPSESPLSQKPALVTAPKQATSSKLTPKATAVLPSNEFPKPPPASPKPVPPSPKAISASPKKEQSPTRPPSPKPTRGVIKLVDLPIPIPELVSPKHSHPRTSDSPKRSSSPKSGSKSTSKSSRSSKTSRQSRPAKPAKTQSTPKAAKAPSPKPANKPSSTKAALPKGAKGIAKAMAKLAMAKETPIEPPPQAEPMDVDGTDHPASGREPPAVLTSQINGDDEVMKEEFCKGNKTPKVEPKKEAAKKPENVAGTRRRSNRIRVNRWDEGPSLAAAAAAAAAAGFTLASHVPASMASVQQSAASMMSLGANLNQHRLLNDSVLPPPSSALLPPSAFEGDKPVKVKSRWRRTSELEMGAGSLSSATSLAATPLSVPDSNVPSPAATLPPPLSPTPPPHPPADEPLPPPPVELPPKPSYVTDHPEITERLKNFEIIRENIYLTARHRSKEAKRMVCECTLSEDEILRGEPGCGEDCLNRLLFIECSNRCTLGDYCSNKRFQNCEYSKCTVVRTEKKGLGLVASTHIPSGEFLFEYVGEVLDPKEFRRRAKDYAKEKNLHYYFMALKSDAIIDATGKGNISRFINHSCDPNAETQKWTVNGELRIGFFSKRAIGEHEEVTFDYKLQRYGKEAQRCYCESANCRGWIGDEPEKDDKEEKDRNWEKMKDKKEKKKTREELEEEIEKLRLSGIKNRAHTLMLNRLMVRAEDHSSRSQLLALTQADVDQRCLRLFLDYHGLNLLWSWMVDSSAPTSLKVQILDTFSVLPISNKTILLDSKVYGVVERWANLGEASTSSSEPKAQREEDSSPDSEETSDSTGAKDKKLDEQSDPADPDRPVLIAKATALFQTWSTLKEEFRIPKKERLEQMKEHERDADRGYVDHEKALKNESSYDRHWSYDKDMSRAKRRGRESPDSLDWKSRTGRGEDRNGALSSGPRLSKTQRRQLFAMQVEEEERQKRLEEERWTNHQEQCYALGVDPNMSYPQNNGYFHPIGTKNHKFKKPKSRDAASKFFPDGSEMPDMYGPGGMGPPQRYPPPPPSPFMGGPPGPPGTPLSPAFPPFHQMGMGPPGPSPPLGPQGMLPPQGMPPPGMCPGVPLGPPGMFGPPPPGMPFPPGPMPPPGTMGYNPPMPNPPQAGYPAPPFMPGAPPVAMEPPPIDMPPSNPTPPQPASTVLILKLPKNWKICVDKDRRRSYFYHIKTKQAQWTFPSTQDVAAEEAKCGNYKSSKNANDDSDESDEDEDDSESDEEDSSSDEFEEKEEEEDDDEYDDHSMLVEAKRKAQEETIVQTIVAEPRTDVEEPIAEQTSEVIPTSDHPEPAQKKRREGLVTVNIISPRDEEEDYRKGIKKSKIKETKMKLARAKARAKAKAAAALSGKSKSKKAKTCEADTSSNPSRRIKDKFRVQMANVIVALLNPYRKADCKSGRITNTEDFKHLARKLTHFVMVKELKHISTIEDLQCNDNVKHKARDFIRKYMSKFGAVYSRQPDD